MKTYAEIFQKLFDSLTLMEMLCHICNRIFKTDTDCHLFLSRDPKIVGPDQTSNRIKWSVFTNLILEALDARQIAETLIFEQEKWNILLRNSQLMILLF